jgi:hypothetical protein
MAGRGVASPDHATQTYNVNDLLDIRLGQQPDLPLAQFNSLIRAFLDSPAFAEEPTYLLHALDPATSDVLQLVTCPKWEQFSRQCAPQESITKWLGKH